MRGFEHLSVVPTEKQPDPDPFAEFYPSLLGPPEAQQFIVHQDELYCLRPSCDGCPFQDNGCEFEEEILPRQAVPHPRRGVGLEEKAFCVLRFKADQSFETFPKDLWDNPYSDRAYAYEANLHWAYTDPKRTKLHTLKEQVRFYGTPEEFATSAYAPFFDIFDYYDPAHNITSLDYSAIEPRVSTLVSREPQWVEVFKGEPKVIFKEIGLALPQGLKQPKSVMSFGEKVFCHLDGEMDKATFEGQCGKCAAKEHCTTKQDHFKDVPKDWHGLNAEGLYGDEFAKSQDKDRKKELRDISKIVGLALCYGGSGYTVSINMATSVEEADMRIENFFRKLTVLAVYMSGAKKEVMRTGQVKNLFGRTWDVSQYTHSQNPDFKKRRSEMQYGQRLSLNFPIQSTAAELLKIGMIRAVDLIAANNWAPHYGLSFPFAYPEHLPRYTDYKCAMLSSIHDEVMYLLATSEFDKIIPQLYIGMQLDDLMSDHFKLGFMLELDCEYDSTRSWTAETKFDTAKIYLLRHVQGYGTTGAKTTARVSNGGGVALPNFALVEFSDVTPQLLDRLATLQQEMEALPESPDAPLFALGVLHENFLYPHGSKFSQALLDRIGCNYRLVHYHKA